MLPDEYLCGTPLPGSHLLTSETQPINKNHVLIGSPADTINQGPRVPPMQLLEALPTCSACKRFAGLSTPLY